MDTVRDNPFRVALAKLLRNKLATTCFIFLILEILLLASVPRPVFRNGERPDTVLEGEVPSGVNPPQGCPFHTRCPRRMDLCARLKPGLVCVEPEHFVACHLYKPMQSDMNTIGA